MGLIELRSKCGLHITQQKWGDLLDRVDWCHLSTSLKATNQWLHRQCNYLHSGICRDAGDSDSVIWGSLAQTIINHGLTIYTQGRKLRVCDGKLPCSELPSDEEWHLHNTVRCLSFDNLLSVWWDFLTVHMPRNIFHEVMASILSLLVFCGLFATLALH